MNHCWGREFHLTQFFFMKEPQYPDRERAERALCVGGNGRVSFLWAPRWLIKLKTCYIQRCSAPAAPPGVGVNQAGGTDSAVILRDLLFFCFFLVVSWRTWECVVRFSAWFSFPFCRGTVCGFYILPVHRRFVTDWCGEPASLKAWGLNEPGAVLILADSSLTQALLISKHPWR